jgi:hypothetical protein
MSEVKEKKSIVKADCDAKLKKTYEQWAKNNGFQTVSEAIRSHMREVTGFEAVCQV